MRRSWRAFWRSRGVGCWIVSVGVSEKREGTRTDLPVIEDV